MMVFSALRVIAVLASVAVLGEAAAADFSGGGEGAGANVARTATPHKLTRAKALTAPDLASEDQRGAAGPVDPAKAFTARGRSRDGRDLTLPPSEALLGLIKGDGSAPSRSIERFGWPDDRTQVADTTVSPYRTIGYIEALSPSGNYSYCSGFLVAPRTVLTAAHCVYNHDDGGWQDDFLFAPGLAGEDNVPLGYSSYEEVYIPQGYIDEYEGYYASVIGWDIAVIVLSDPLGDALGWMAFGPAAAPAETATLAGYPGDKPFGTMWEEECGLGADPEWPAFTEHDCRTFPGINGAPLFLRDPAGLRVVAMHIATANHDEGIALSITDAFAAWINGVGR